MTELIYKQSESIDFSAAVSSTSSDKELFKSLSTKHSTKSVEQDHVLVQKYLPSRRKNCLRKHTFKLEKIEKCYIRFKCFQLRPLTVFHHAFKAKGNVYISHMTLSRCDSHYYTEILYFIRCFIFFTYLLAINTE